MMNGLELTQKLNLEFEKTGVLESLNILVEKYPQKVVFTSSFGYVDQVITDFIFANNVDIKVITLDTGRLFPETYKTFLSTRDKYKKPIQVYYPPTDKVEQLVSEKGPFSFYESLENRKECCFIRKVIPLKRALNGHKIWITGLRASQSNNRAEMQKFEWDEGNQIIKFNPLMDWSLEETIDYVKKNNVPYNVLHDQGFVSIGCQPCTRAIQPGEDFRAGRWWWEQGSGKECGLHALK